MQPAEVISSNSIVIAPGVELVLSECDAISVAHSCSKYVAFLNRV